MARLGSRRPEEEAARAEALVRARIDQALAEFQEALDRTLARAKAETLSALADEERRIAEERRRVIADREDRAGAELFAKLADEQKRLEQRLTGWSADFERSQRALGDQIATLDQRRRELAEGIAAKLETEAERVEPLLADARAALARMRDEVDVRVREAMQAAEGEIEAQAQERRRALHEVAERLRRRERALGEQIEREEAEASLRIAARFEDVERRQVEAVQRTVERESARFAELAGHEFATVAKTTREEARRKLQRELDRAVEQFSHNAEAVLADRLAKVADTGHQRIDRRTREASAALETHRDELARSLDKRLAEVETEFRARLERAVASLEAERGQLDTRVRELQRRLDELERRGR